MDVGLPKFVIKCRFWQRGQDPNVENGRSRHAWRVEFKQVKEFLNYLYNSKEEFENVLQNPETQLLK
jgi:hypothetical protein